MRGELLGFGIAMRTKRALRLGSEENVGDGKVALGARGPILAGYQLLNLRKALRGQRMRPEIALQRVRTHLGGLIGGIQRLRLEFPVELLEFLENPDRAFRRISRLHGESSSLSIRLQLLILAVARFEDGDGDSE